MPILSFAACPPLADVLQEETHFLLALARDIACGSRSTEMLSISGPVWASKAWVGNFFLGQTPARAFLRLYSNLSLP